MIEGRSRIALWTGTWIWIVALNVRDTGRMTVPVVVGLVGGIAVGVAGAPRPWAVMAAYFGWVTGAGVVFEVLVGSALAGVRDYGPARYAPSRHGTVFLGFLGAVHGLGLTEVSSPPAVGFLAGVLLAVVVAGALVRTVGQAIAWTWLDA